MSFAYDIIIRPIVTEKSMADGALKKYTFEVAKDANKFQIKEAIEKVFPGTKVKSVNTMNVRGQMRRQGRYTGYTASWNKAIVTLTEDSKTIEFFEGMM